MADGRGAPAVAGADRDTLALADAVTALPPGPAARHAAFRLPVRALPLPTHAADARLPRLASGVAAAAVVGIPVRIDAEVVAGFHPVELAAAPIDRADVQSRGVAAPLPVLGAGGVVRAAAVGADAPVATLA